MTTAEATAADGAILLADEAATLALGTAIAPLLRAGDAIALLGTLGAGKTTLARGLLGGLGLEDDAPSPSFPLVVAYAPPETRVPVWHVDLYRLDHADQAEELGLADARMHAALLVEWPERIGFERWSDVLALRLEVIPDGGRRLTWAAGPSWASRWPPILPR